MKRHPHEIDIPDEIEFDAEFSDILIKRFESGKFTTESLYKMCNSSRRLIHLLGTFENDTEEEKIWYTGSYTCSFRQFQICIQWLKQIKKP